MKIQLSMDQLLLLRNSDPTLYAHATSRGWVTVDNKAEIDTEKIPSNQYRKKFEDWAAEQDVAQKQAEAEKRQQREKDEQNAKAVDARIRWWINQGLVNSDANAKMLIDFVNSHKKLRAVTVVTPDLIDAVVQILRHEGKLEWHVPQPTPAQTPAPAIRMLPNGEPELDINASDSEMLRASIPQLRDLSKRRGEHLGGAQEQRDKWGRPAGSVAGNITVDSIRRSGPSQVR